MTTFRRLMVSLPDSKRQTLTRSLEVSAQKYACAMIVPYPTYNEGNSVDQRSKTEIGGYDGERLKFALSGVCEVAAPARLRRSASPARSVPTPTETQYKYFRTSTSYQSRRRLVVAEACITAEREGSVPKSQKNQTSIYIISYIVLLDIRMRCTTRMCSAVV